MGGTMEVVYRRPDGMIIRSIALWSHRRGPIGEWMLGDGPLQEVEGEFLHKGGRLSEAEFKALVALSPG